MDFDGDFPEKEIAMYYLYNVIYCKGGKPKG